LYRSFANQREAREVADASQPEFAQGQASSPSFSARASLRRQRRDHLDRLPLRRPPNGADGATARAGIGRLTAFLMCVGAVQILVTATGDLIAHWRVI
jgi:hypothetical protein